MAAQHAGVDDPIGGLSLLSHLGTPCRGHICVTYHYLKSYKIYVNGQLGGTQTTVNDALSSVVDSPTASPRDSFMGTRRIGTNPLKGYFRDFRVYSRVLT
jgi:hypothetical protein